MSTVYVISRTTNDRWPVPLRPECDRTYYDPRTGLDEGLHELIERMDQQGYDVLMSRAALLAELDKRGVYYGEEAQP